jgi:hypothetical protein
MNLVDRPTLEYPSLDDTKKSIWLVEILPDPMLSLMSCQMHAFDIAKAPEYVALSYM